MSVGKDPEQGVRDPCKHLVKDFRERWHQWKGPGAGDAWREPNAKEKPEGGSRGEDRVRDKEGMCDQWPDAETLSFFSIVSFAYGSKHMDTEETSLTLL